MRTIPITLASLLVVTGCSTAEPGTPVAGTEPVTTTTTATSAPSGPPSSPAPGGTRPKDLDLAAVDVCALVGELPLRDYGLDTDRPPVGGESSVFPGSRDCFAGGIENNLALTVVAVTTEGTDSYVDSVTAQPTSREVAGYPLVVLKPRNPANCLGVVDVHDGQMLYLAYGLGSPGTQPITPQDQLCRTVPTIAAAAVAALH